MLDTNVLISALLFPSQKFNSIMEYIFAEHELVLSSYVVEELKSVVRRTKVSQTASTPNGELDGEIECVFILWRQCRTICKFG